MVEANFSEEIKSARAYQYSLISQIKSEYEDLKASKI